MTPDWKNMEALTPADFLEYPLWEFALDIESVDEFAVRPVLKLPVNDLGNRFVGTQVRLANGAPCWASLSNLELNDPEKTHRILTASFYLNGEWNYLARPQDPGQEKYGPKALARKLGIGVDQVFPIAYDISAYCVGDENVLRGTITDSAPGKV